MKRIEGLEEQVADKDKRLTMFDARERSQQALASFIENGGLDVTVNESESFSGSLSNILV